MDNDGDGTISDESGRGRVEVRILDLGWASLDPTESIRKLQKDRRSLDFRKPFNPE